MCLQVIDAYLEAYGHVSDMDERRRLAQCITNLMYRRPRYDLRAGYFLRQYRLECLCLRMQAALLKQLLDRHVSPLSPTTHSFSFYYF